MNFFFKSFYHALQGILTLFRTERNAQIHLSVMIIVLLWGFLLDITSTEWNIVIVCIVLVISMEGMNTAVETLANAVTEEKHPLIKKAKDVAAGAVLISAIGALIVGIKVLVLPTIQQLLY